MFYQVIDASRAAYEVRDLELAVTNITMTNIRTAIGALDLDETLSKRDEINERLLRVLDAATEPWGTKITRVELKDVRPPEDVQVSMAKQLDRRSRAAGRDTARRRSSSRRRSWRRRAPSRRRSSPPRDGSKRRSATPRRASGSPRPRREPPTAVSKAVAEGNVQALNYFVAQKYVEAMTQIGASPNSRLVLMPMETSGLVGTIAGIAELARIVARPAE